MAEIIKELFKICLELPRKRKERLIRELQSSIEKEDRMQDNDKRFNLLLRAASDVCGGDVLSHIKDFNLVMGRRVISYKMHQEGYSYPTIGKFLMKDHTSVYQAVKKMDEAFELNVKKELKYWYDFIEKVEEYEKEMESNLV